MLALVELAGRGRARRARTGAVAPAPAPDVEADAGKTWELLNIRGMAGRTDNLWRYELVKLAERLGSNPSYHAAVMAIESGFDPKARNPVSNASGLIQLMPFLLKKWGMTGAQVRAMSSLDQLALVERFYKGHRGRLKTACDHYMATFLPKYLGKPPEFVLAEKGHPWYDQNPGFDREKKGYFTVGDVCIPVNARVAEAEGKPRIVVTPEARPPRGIGGRSSLALVGLALAIPVGIAVARARR